MQLINAIRRRNLVEFVYERHRRCVIPAVYGFHSGTGNLVLRAYQVRGSGKDREPPFWGMFRIDRMVGLKVTDEVFVEDPPEYRRQDPDISPVYAQL